MYKFFRPLLFLVDPETIHSLVFRILRLPGVKAILKTVYQVQDHRLEKNLLGLTFKNPVGLAAGFDKDASHIDSLAALGFGFIEIGTLTPEAQAGNDKPRLFRLPKDHALINRMGFNNKGAAAAVERLKDLKYPIIIGGNIGKNKVTPNESAEDDYISCFNTLFGYVDYFVVNVSSPNTPGLRALQEKAPLERLLRKVKDLSLTKSPVKPVLLKIAPDLTAGQLEDIVEILKTSGIDGVIATNTTVCRDDLMTGSEKLGRIGAGGLSGKPLTKRATEVIRFLREKLGKDYPIIGVGGIMSADDALDKIRAGADLVQLYTGFVYEGPSLIRKINKKLLAQRY